MKEPKQRWLGHVLRQVLLRDILEGRMSGRRRKGRKIVEMISNINNEICYDILKKQAEDRIFCDVPDLAKKTSLSSICQYSNICSYLCLFRYNTNVMDRWTDISVMTTGIGISWLYTTCYHREKNTNSKFHKVNIGQLKKYVSK